MSIEIRNSHDKDVIMVYRCEHGRIQLEKRLKIGEIRVCIKKAEEGGISESNKSDFEVFQMLLIGAHTIFISRKQSNEIEVFQSWESFGRKQPEFVIQNKKLCRELLLLL